MIKVQTQREPCIHDRTVLQRCEEPGRFLLAGQVLRWLDYRALVTNENRWMDQAVRCDVLGRHGFDLFQVTECLDRM